MPEELAVTIAPPTLLADGGSNPVVYVQLLGPGGEPRIATRETEVALNSSNPLVGILPDRVLIPVGRSFAVAPLTTTSVAGKATVRALTSEGAIATSEVTTVSAVEATAPWRIALYAAPPHLVAGLGPPGILSAVLLGANGRAIPAPEDLTLVLSSSNPGVVRVEAQAIIPKGAHFVNVELEPGAVGAAVLSALRPGFASEFTEVRVVAQGAKAEALALYLAPPVLGSEGGEHEGVVVQGVDGEGKPTILPCVPVYLASSSPATVDLDLRVEAGCGLRAQYMTARVRPGSPGEATITASASGLRPAMAALTVQGQLASQLTAYLAPEKVLAVETPSGFFVIQVVDGSGVPISSRRDVRVSVVRTGESTRGEAVIPAGASYIGSALGGFQSVAPVQMWFGNPGLTSALLSVTPVELPASVEVIASHGPVFPGVQVPVQVRVQSAGDPVAGAKLFWTAANGVLTDAAQETDGDGAGKALFVARDPGSGMVAVSATLVGYRQAQAQAEIAVISPVIPASPPGLFGIPVVYLFVLFLAALIGYLGYKLFIILRWRA
ncbi:MAG: hypothetical protein HY680_00140 [Chloroflexi bacterium]|nr:hypothetical protein [Chloroflexota bacterium]